MSTRVNSKNLTRSQLLEAGMQVMFEKGYSNAGIQQVLDRADVPKGSFYYYFESKEEFGLQIINHFDDLYTAKVLKCLRPSSTDETPLGRLRIFCECNKRSMEEMQCRKGCLVGNLSQEMADQSERLRCRLEQIFTKWRDLFAACIVEGQQIGEISDRFGAAAMADLFLSGWEGAVMRAKSTKTVQPIDNFIHVMFEQILKA